VREFTTKTFDGNYYSSTMQPYACAHSLGDVMSRANVFFFSRICLSDNFNHLSACFFCFRQI